MQAAERSLEERFTGAPSILDYVERFHEILAGNRQQLAYNGLSEIVRAHGRSFGPVGWGRAHPGLRRGDSHNCFPNSYRLATDHPDQLVYVEGLAYTGLVPVHHAWAVTHSGEVVDPTWDETEMDTLPVEQWEYVGIPFSFRFVLDTAARREVYGLLDEVAVFRQPLPVEAIHESYRGA